VTTVLGLALAVLAGARSPAGEAGGKAKHPEPPGVLEIRALYDETQAAIVAGPLTERKRTFSGCEPYEDVLRVLHLDAAGRVRHYRNSGGSEDSMVTRDFYYDRQSRLRFVFIQAGAVNDTRIEHRIYLDEGGRRIREFQKRLSGPGYTFPGTPWPDGDLVLRPAEAFRAPTPCPEAGHK
jgi:hypothetical protein